MSSLPREVANLVFSLHQAVCFSHRVDEIVQLYEVQFREINDKFYINTPWPAASLIAKECANDELFMCLYTEITTKALFNKYKSQTVYDQILAWHNYIKLFELFIAYSGDAKKTYLLSNNWINEIITEFVYQFQGVCQYRSQLTKRSSDEIKVLVENKNTWNLPKVVSILKSLGHLINHSNEFYQKFGFFATVETVRLECLIGDYSACLKSASIILKEDRSDYFAISQLQHINFYYHTGVAHLMSRQLSHAVNTFSDIILHVNRVFKHVQRSQISTQISKTIEKLIVFTALTSLLCPGLRLEDQVKELVDKGPAHAPGTFRNNDSSENKAWTEKLRRISDGDILVYTELFENNCPKFIHPAIPDYANLTNDYNMDAFDTQVNVFMTEVLQCLSVRKIRSYLKLYTSIDISKLARFNELSEDALVAQLLSYKHKNIEVVNDVATSISDVQYHFSGSNLVIESTNNKKDRLLDVERHFNSGIRKNQELQNTLTKYFSHFNL